MKKLLLLLVAWLVSQPVLYAQTSLQEGDLAFVGINAPLNEFAFVLFQDVTAGTEIRFTDCGWNRLSSQFDCLGGDKPDVIWTADQFYPLGTAVTIDGAGLANKGMLSGGALHLNEQGDQIFAYQGDINTPSFITAITTNVAPGSNDFDWDLTVSNEQESGIPENLGTGSNATRLHLFDAEFPFWQYRCQTNQVDLALVMQTVFNTNDWISDPSNAFYPLVPPCVEEEVPCIQPEVPRMSMRDGLFCTGTTGDLNIRGNLNDATHWAVYKQGCGVELLGTTSTDVFPITINYSGEQFFIRGEGGCVDDDGPCGLAAYTLDREAPETPVITGPTEILCIGESATITISGEVNDGTWHIYTDSCGGTEIAVTTDSLFTVSPTQTTTYYISGQIDENCKGNPVWSCDSITINVDPYHVPDVPRMSMRDGLFCTGSTGDLNIQGNLNDATHWAIYADECGQTLLGTTPKNYFEVRMNDNPSTFFVRGEGGSGVCADKYDDCGMASYSMDRVGPEDPVISGPTDILCIGESATITISGATNDGAWHIYTDSCGGTEIAVTTDSIYAVSPTETTTYYISGRIDENCKGEPIWSCDSITINVDPYHVPDVPRMSMRDGLFCTGSTGDLNIQGNLNDATHWAIYADECGQTLLGTTPKNYFEVRMNDNPSTFFVRGEGGSGVCADKYDDCGMASYSMDRVAPEDPIISVPSDTICLGDSTEISILGATNDGTWHIYTDSCGGNEIGVTTASSFMVTPTQTTTYYISGEIDQNCKGEPIWSCDSITIHVGADYDRPEVTLSSSVDISCPGDIVIVTISGDNSLDGRWNIYTDKCLGNRLGSSSDETFGVDPSVTTTYYVSGYFGEDCKGDPIWSCDSITIKVRDDLPPSLGLTSSDDFLCTGEIAIVTIDGEASQNGRWTIYTDECGGTKLGSTVDETFGVNPTVTSTYYVSGYYGLSCTGDSIWSCDSITIQAGDPIVPEVSLSYDGDTTCPGELRMVTISGDTSLDGSWNVYTDRCLGTKLGTTADNTFGVNPEQTTTYYVSGYFGIDCTGEEVWSCDSITIQVDEYQKPDVPSMLMVDGLFCTGSQGDLLIYGNLNDATHWAIYEDECGENLLGTTTGNSFEVTINKEPHDFYVRGEGMQGECADQNAQCGKVTYYLDKEAPEQPIISGPTDTVCIGETVSITISGATNDGSWHIYTDSCGGTELGVTTDSIFTVSPTQTTTYYISGEIDMNCKGDPVWSCDSITIIVDPYHVPDKPHMLMVDGLFCTGSQGDLLIYGDLNDASHWAIYEDECGENLLGTTTSNSFEVTIKKEPHDFFVRGEGGAGYCADKYYDCGKVTYYLDREAPEDPVISGPTDTVCIGETVSITISGALNDGSWHIYTDSCGGTEVAVITDSIFTVSPTQTTTYYISGQIDENCKGDPIWSCDSITIIVDPYHVPDKPYMYMYDGLFCTGSTGDLIISGNLNDASYWAIYEDACQGNLLGTTTENSFEVTINKEPHSFYVRGEGGTGYCADKYADCGKATYFLDREAPEDPVISGPTDTLCLGDTAVITISGALNDGSWHIYTDSCGGTEVAVIMDSTFAVTPTQTTTYYISGEIDENCKGEPIWSCDSITIHVDDYVKPDVPGVYMWDGLFCTGTKGDLIMEGNLNDATHWAIYEDACGGNLLGTTTGNSFEVTITKEPHSFYVRGEGQGACAARYDQCREVTYYIDKHAPEIHQLSLSSPSIQRGEEVTINIDGDLNDGSWYIYEGSCDGTLLTITQESSYTVSPTTTTTYYVSGEIENCKGDPDFPCVAITVPVVDEVINIGSQYCGVNDMAIDGIVVAETATTSSMYEFFITDNAGMSRTFVKNSPSVSLLEFNDGVGAGYVGYSTTYSIQVRPYFADGSGQYGDICQFTTTNMPCSEVAYYGAGYLQVDLDDEIPAVAVTGAQSYRFTIRDGVTNAVNVVESPTPSMNLLMMPTGTAFYGQYYSIGVSAVVNGQTVPTCTEKWVWAIYIPVTQLQPMSDNSITINEVLTCDPVAGALTYEFYFSNYYYTGTVYSSDNQVSMSELPGYPYTHQWYAVWVRTIHHGQYGATTYSNWGNYTYVYLEPQAQAAPSQLVLGEELSEEPVVSTYPNPFTSNCTLSIELPESQNVRISVVDVMGREVALVCDQNLEAGKYTFDWEGIDAENNEVKTGVYFVNFLLGDQQITKSIVRQQ